jgi:hypothetical protein
MVNPHSLITGGLPHLHEEAEAAEHGQATVLDLLNLELSERLRVISQAEGVEGATRVQAVQALHTRRLAGSAERLSLAHQRHLARDGGNDALGVHQVLVACRCEGQKATGQTGQEQPGAALHQSMGRPQTLHVLHRSSSVLLFLLNNCQWRDSPLLLCIQIKLHHIFKCQKAHTFTCQKARKLAFSYQSQPFIWNSPR